MEAKAGRTRHSWYRAGDGKSACRHCNTIRLEGFIPKRYSWLGQIDGREWYYDSDKAPNCPPRPGDELRGLP